MRYAAIIYGYASVLLFALGTVMGFVGLASITWLLTARDHASNVVGVVAAILFGVLFAYPFAVDFRTALEARRHRVM